MSVEKLTNLVLQNRKLDDARKNTKTTDSNLFDP